LWEEILVDFERFRGSDRIREFWLDGIPETMRGKVWMRETGNSNSLTNELF